MAVHRCSWGTSSELMQSYHDQEWGVPVKDDQLLFEFLLLEGAQAGLSWSTILNKREGYRKLFAGFDPDRIARFTSSKVEKLLKDASIVRNRLKVESAITNAKAFLAIQQEGSFSEFLWSFVGGQPVTNRWESLSELPVSTPEALAMSKALKKTGFRFVGPTICYAFMQAVGMVNDHETSCFRHREICNLNKKESVARRKR